MAREACRKSGPGCTFHRPRGVHRNRAAVQGAKPRRAPARVVPETVQQLFRNQALPVERRLGDPAVVQPQAAFRGACSEAAALDFHRRTP